MHSLDLHKQSIHLISANILNLQISPLNNKYFQVQNTASTL